MWCQQVWKLYLESQGVGSSNRCHHLDQPDNRYVCTDVEHVRTDGTDIEHVGIHDEHVGIDDEHVSTDDEQVGTSYGVPHGRHMLMEVMS